MYKHYTDLIRGEAGQSQLMRANSTQWLNSFLSRTIIDMKIGHNHDHSYRSSVGLRFQLRQD